MKLIHLTRSKIVYHNVVLLARKTRHKPTANN